MDETDYEKEERKALRDMFAIAAMNAIIINWSCHDEKGMALRAYQVADAMMVARDLS